MDWDVWSQLLSGALALALLGGIESVAIAKTIARAAERSSSPTRSSSRRVSRTC